MNVKKWIRRKAAVISLALSDTEKSMIGQSSDPIKTDNHHVRRQTQGTLADSLINGEVTQEVIDLRWRTYKILNHIDDTIKNVVGYDENGAPILKTRTELNHMFLDKVKTEPSDNYPIEMVVTNYEITKGVYDSLTNEFLETYNEQKNADEKDVSSIGEISGLEYFATNNFDKFISVGRVSIPKFKIENYTIKLHVRKISEDERLLEFFVSKYPSEDKRSVLFLSELKKAKEKPLTSSLLEIKEVEFITNKTLGVKDNLHYKYQIVNFDKIVEFGEYQVIKFKSKTIINGEDIVEKHRSNDLDHKYSKKERKKI